jgi:hypothetical protein
VSEEPEPTRFDRIADRQEVIVTVGGMVLWAVALTVLVVFFRHDLQRHHATWWYWTCGYGLLLGAYGVRFSIRRRR